MNINEFWNTLCDDFGYRFFTGVPNEELGLLFNSLSKDVLHFVPTINESVSVGIAAGASLAGQKSAVLCSPYTFITAFSQIYDFVLPNKVPVLFIGINGLEYSGIKQFCFSNRLSVVKDVIDYISEEGLPAVLKFN